MSSDGIVLRKPLSVNLGDLDAIQDIGYFLLCDLPVHAVDGADRRLAKGLSGPDAEIAGALPQP